MANDKATLFIIKPKHWWNYLNPFWWRRKRLIEVIMEYQWNHKGVKEKTEKAVRDAILYGAGYYNHDIKVIFKDVE